MDGPPPPNRVVILQFESASALKNWWESGLEKLQKEVGHKYADFQTFAVEGIEQKLRGGRRRVACAARRFRVREREWTCADCRSRA